MWQWLNGKKLLIGAICFFVGDALGKAVFPHFTVVPEWLKMAQDVLLYAGDVLVPVGLGHKGYKVYQDSKAVKNGNNPTS